MEIPEIRTNIREIGIPDIRGTSSLIENPPLAVPTYPPVTCLLYTSPSPRDKRQSRMPSSA